ncbi:hypothetical protein F5Y16DRAFT_414690 [Xylariaceae sp. FL0255]|nr:hypothetical protein F5Y16DRAFT_414690 [Xylariaceae sp. FL0255]
MTFLDQLRQPLVIHPACDHTHTVIFLHRFPSDSSEYEVRSKLLSAKKSRDHVTLREKFPSIRWVYPHPNGDNSDKKSGKNLSLEDMTKLSLSTQESTMPHITQIILREAERIGGLHRIILGGQGDTAIAAHEAMRSFPQPDCDTLGSPQKLKHFIEQHFHNQKWSDIRDLTLGGFIGMHAENGQHTRDQKEHGLMGRFANLTKVNEMIVKNTPHCFIHGGYKTQTVTWDGRRIEEVEEFLRDLGIPTSGDGKTLSCTPENRDLLTPKLRTNPQEKQQPKENPRSDVDKHLAEVKKQKAADEELRKRILMRIECDKADRIFRQQREIQRRNAIKQEDDANTLSEYYGGNEEPNASFSEDVNFGEHSGPDEDGDPNKNNSSAGKSDMD